MAKKRKEKEKLFEDIQFQDVQRAKRAVTAAKINQTRIMVGLVIAVIATGLAALGFLINPDSDNATIYIGCSMFLAVVAYLVGGGIGKALKVAWKITKFGWFVIPVFPIDVLMAIVFFIFSIAGLLFIPVVFVGINYIQHKRTLDAAVSYLAQYGYVANALEE